MKRRYSPAARRAHLAHLRAKYGKPVVQEVTTLPEFEKAAGIYIEAYEGGFLTKQELAELVIEAWQQHKPAVQPEPAPMPEPPAEDKPWWLHHIDATVDDAGEIHLTIDGQPQPAPKPEQPIDCDCPACLAEQQPALQGRCIGCGVLTPDGVDVDVDGLFGQDWCCKDCQKEPWAKPIEGHYSFDPEGGAA